jgi:hypothetical protein
MSQMGQSRRCQKGRLKLSDAERATLAEIGHRLGRKVLAEVATVARLAATYMILSFRWPRRLPR